jgi:hypothetical protein
MFWNVPIGLTRGTEFLVSRTGLYIIAKKTGSFSRDRDPRFLGGTQKLISPTQKVPVCKAAGSLPRASSLSTGRVCLLRASSLPSGRVCPSYRVVPLSEPGICTSCSLFTRSHIVVLHDSPSGRICTNIFDLSI